MSLVSRGWCKNVALIFTSCGLLIMDDQPCRLVTNLIILLANKSFMSVKTERSSQNQSISTPLNPTLLFDGTLGSNRLPVQT